MSNDLLIKQRPVIEFLAAEGFSAANIHARMKTVYGEMCISDCAVRKCMRIFKGEDPRETILRDRKRSGRPLSASVTAHREKVDCMITANRSVKQKEIANAVGISKEQVHHIVTTVLGYRKVSARCVPRQLIVKMKAQRKDMCTQLLERYNAEGEAFLQRILTGDETWVHHYDPEFALFNKLLSGISPSEPQTDSLKHADAALSSSSLDSSLVKVKDVVSSSGLSACRQSAN
ncbi:histone-lysine N-methyltransferase SETMAR-like protein [Plakobranchus ocellatus]|uniref:Histone-lysine N-methyltransferase SETMAR-like protein n=1 Tax=Plakobranchus ocellatus TaxID=259542 RepID=A0AAV4C1F4_9GAST|nr:histone-lysine N-methyltransferase SETMAR-like protein [Plakobranchus ocellatus]